MNHPTSSVTNTINEKPHYKEEVKENEMGRTFIINEINACRILVGKTEQIIRKTKT
jgi:hypothetical protein